MMKKKTLTGRILIGVGFILCFLGFEMLKIPSDIVLFENTDKVIGTGVFILGILCLIASNFFRKPKAGNH